MTIEVDMTPEKAKAELLELIHSRDAKDFQLGITVSDLRWTVTVEDIEGRSGRTIGEGDSFYRSVVRSEAGSGTMRGRAGDAVEGQ